MTKVIRMTLDPASIDAAVKELRDYAKWVQTKAKELAERLAQYGLTRVEAEYANALYDGNKDVSVTVEDRGNNTYAIVAGGESVLFLEFGAGVTYGYGHPQAGDFGYGPGTYPSDKGHWNDPRGWYIPKANGGGHTYGNPPSMTMYLTAKELRDWITEVAKEVFST